MPRVRSNGIDIEYDSFGDTQDTPLLLIQGLGMQMIAWHEDLCSRLTARGFHVIRFDNRDVGLSTRIEGGPAPDIMAAIAGDASSASYTLNDMADDTAGLLEALNIPAAHIVGVSMGGMIAQTLAIRHPSRVLTLTSMMSRTGNPDVGQPTPEAGMALIVAPPALDRDSLVEHGVGIFRVIGSKGELFNEDRIRAVAQRGYDRGYNPLGMARQLVAILASGDRSNALRALAVPTLVIHGQDDPLVRVDGGEDTARVIPGARLMIVPGLAHDLPEQLWPVFIEAVVDNTARVAAAHSATGD